MVGVRLAYAECIRFTLDELFVGQFFCRHVNDSV